VIIFLITITITFIVESAIIISSDEDYNSYDQDISGEVFNGML